MSDILGPYDDLPLHQVAQPLRIVGSLHPRWTERWYLNVQDADGHLRLIVGGGHYPASRTLETYACGLHQGRQVNRRSQTETSDRLALDTGSGPWVRVVEPMRTWEVGIDDPSLQADLRFTATGPPHLFRPFVVPADPDGDPLAVDDIQHFVQAGTITGSLAVDGTAVDLAGARGYRDRTWGIRSRRPRLHLWIVGHLDGGRRLAAIRQERAGGQVMTSELAFIKEEVTLQASIDRHDVTVDPISRQVDHARLEGQCGHDRVAVEIERLGEGIRLNGAGYTARQGERRSAAVGGESWDLTDADTLREIGPGTIDSPVRIRVEWGRETATGPGIAEFALGRDHHRYGVQLPRRERREPTTSPMKEHPT